MMSEIEIEAGITTYTFVNGVEKRKQAFPWSSFHKSMSTLAVNFEGLQKSIQDAFFSFKPFVEATTRSLAVPLNAETRDLRPPLSPPRH